MPPILMWLDFLPGVEISWQVYVWASNRNCLNLDLGGFKGLRRLAANTFTAESETQRKAVGC